LHFAGANFVLNRSRRAIFNAGSPLLNGPAAQEMIVPANFVLLKKGQILAVVSLKCVSFQKVNRIQTETIFCFFLVQMS
jgi:hypothetical protein